MFLKKFLKSLKKANSESKSKDEAVPSQKLRGMYVEVGTVQVPDDFSRYRQE